MWKEAPPTLWPASIIVTLFTVRRHNMKTQQELQRDGLEAEQAGQGKMTADDEIRFAELIEARKNLAEWQSSLANTTEAEMADLQFDHPGFVDGEHFTAYAEEVKQLKRERRHEEAIALLLKLIAATEAESRDPGGSDRVAPWYYEQLAIIYRKEGRIDDEVASLERYESRCNELGNNAGSLAERLAKARSKNEKAASQSKAIIVPPSGLLIEGTEKRTESSNPPVTGKGRLAEFLQKAKTKFPELIEFRIDLPKTFVPKPRAENKEPARWVQPGEVIKVSNYSIRRGFFYVGGQLKSLAPFDLNEDLSLLDPTLEVGADDPDYANIKPEYWFGYGGFSPGDRAEFLAWLASDRSDPKTFIEYVFLYLCGIERRLLIDDKEGMVSDDERKALMQELSRLKSIYYDHRSFRNHISRLLSYVWAINYRKFDEPPDYDLLVAKKSFNPAFKIVLAQTALRGEPVSANLALAWVRSHPDFTLRNPARRCPELYDTLFKMRYKQRFGDGIDIRPGRAKLRLELNPANSSLYYSYFDPDLGLPDVSRQKAPFQKLMALAGACADELDSFSRFLAKAGNSPESLQALSFLPDDLAALNIYPQLEQFRAWVKMKVSDFNVLASEQSLADCPLGKEQLHQRQLFQCDGLVSVKSLLGQLGKDVPSAINGKVAQMMASIVQKTGYGVAPDIRFHHAKPDIDGKVVLFDGGHGADFAPSNEFDKVGTILRLGALVASADEHISDSEVSALQDVIAQNSRLTETEKRSLDAYMLWRLNTPANMLGLKKRLDLLSASEKVAISHILIGVALADGQIDPAEINQLEKLYTQLGLDKTIVVSDIHNISSSRSPSLGQEKKIHIDTSARSQTVADSTFALDRDRLQLYEQETKKAQSVLESIFTDEVLLDEPEIEGDATGQANNGSFPGLDAKYQRLYDKLTTKTEWAYEDLEGLCDGLQLMTAGAVETINDWAFDKAGAPLIEVDSTVFIDIELAEEIASLQTQEPLP